MAGYDFQNMINKSSGFMIELGVSALLGYGCASVFKIFNPGHAALFSATTLAVSYLTAPIFKNFFEGAHSNEQSRLLGKVLNIATSVALSGFALGQVAGIAVPFGAGAMIWGSVWVTQLALQFLVNHQSSSRRTV